MFGEAFGVKSHSVPKSGNPVTEIHSRPARTWFVGVAGEGIACGKDASQERMQGQRVARSSVIGRPGQANFKVGGRLKADSFAVNDGLRIERPTILANQPRRSIQEFIS